MRAGKLRDLLTIQERTTTANDYGEEIATWKTFAHVWGEVVDTSGREFVEGRQDNAQTFTRIFIRKHTGVRPEMRVKHADRYYEIEAVLRPTNKNDRLQLMCEEIWPSE
jgi:SPP1 family predicted phage head-tail adaptor